MFAARENPCRAACLWSDPSRRCFFGERIAPEWSKTGPDSRVTPEEDTGKPDSSDAQTPDGSAAAPAQSTTAEDKRAAMELYHKQPENNTPFRVDNLFPGDSETKCFRGRVSYHENSLFHTGEVKINLNDRKPVIQEHEFILEPGMAAVKVFFIESDGTWAVYYAFTLIMFPAGLPMC